MEGYVPEKFSEEVNIINKITYSDHRTVFDPVENLTELQLLENLKSTNVSVSYLEKAINLLEEDILVMKEHITGLYNKKV